MIGRRSTIGLALFCALAFSAFAAQDVMAQVGVKSTNTTAVTCVADKEGEFEDEHCDNKLAVPVGKFEHVEIPNDTTTEIEVSQEGTSKLNYTVAGVVTEITCKKAASVAEKSFLHNVETEGKHTVTGTAKVNFTECTVVKPSKCVVIEPIVATASGVGVEGLGASKNEMGVELVGEGDESTLAGLSFENKGAEKCSLAGGGTSGLMVKGSAIATGKVAQGNKQSGATAVYEDANEMETLENALKKASFSGAFTVSMSSGGDPIALTTVT